MGKDEIQKLLDNLHIMSHEEKAYTLALLDELDQRKRVLLAQSDFLAFIAAIDPTYKFGLHLKRLGSLLMQVEMGQKDRIAVSMGPRFGKSQMISIYFPAWYIGKHPDHKLIMASHTLDLAVDMARKVRNLMQSEDYKRIFPGVSIAADAKAAGKWNTTKGGEVFAIGVGGALAGRGGDLIVVDDPLSEQDIKAGNTSSLDTVYEWYRAGLRTRLMPGGRICVLHCLVGDTRVTMADGAEKFLRDVRPGDMVASYDNGKFRPAKVLGWANQGVDNIYSLHLRSGVIIKGNERHPLLVDFKGTQKWVTIKNLQPGMHLVSMKDAQIPRIANPFAGFVKAVTTKSAFVREPKVGFLKKWYTQLINAPLMAAIGHQNPKQNPGCAPRVSLKRTTIRRSQTLLTGLLGTTANGKVRLALLMAVQSLHTLKDSVLLAATRLTIGRARPRGLIIARPSAVTPTLRCSMGSLATSTTNYFPSKMENAPSAGSLHTMEIPRRNGKYADWLLTTATKPIKYVRSCVTHVISSLRSAIPSTYSERLLPTLSITLDELVAIAPDGREEVFDIQVEGTENFLANGVVSHNTRWHQRDLIGRIIKDSVMNPEADQYEVFEFPAILESPNPLADPKNPYYDPEEPKVLEKSLWPEQWSLESLYKTRASMPAWQWNAQYMQNPTAQEAALIKRDQIRWWEGERPPQVDYIVQGWDTAMTTKERSDYSVCQTWGVWKTEEGVDNVILLNRVKGKWEFPELKQIAHEQAKEWNPDSLIIETKASGQPLVDELRRSGIFVSEFSPGKGQDKIARVNAISDMFASGQVWFPEIRWATEVVEELLAFPAGEHDDEVDCATLCLMRIRKGGLVKLASDYEEPDIMQSRPRKSAYY